MKLRTLAALLFRISGALLLLKGVFDGFDALIYFHNAMRFIESGCFALIGCCVICFSKQLANIFCRGLDDDSI